MAKAKKKNLAESIRQRFAALGGVELELPKRDPIRQPRHADRIQARFARHEKESSTKSRRESASRGK